MCVCDRREKKKEKTNHFIHAGKQYYVNESHFRLITLNDDERTEKKKPSMQQCNRKSTIIDIMYLSGSLLYVVLIPINDSFEWRKKKEKKINIISDDTNKKKCKLNRKIEIP